MEMSKYEKALERIRNKPKDYTFNEAKTLLEKIGFEEVKHGKTSGSGYKFYRKKDNRVFFCHKPHPRKVMTEGAVEALLELLREAGEIK